jgi:hypothetical protein
MSSGDKTKPTEPPKAGREERNPFDITQRSEREVAAEIAARLASWKQARGRSHSTAPQGSGASRTVDAESPRSQTPPAPVQPARVPKFGEHAGPGWNAGDTPPPAESVPSSMVESSAPIAPFAMRRAMPPAPSPRRSGPQAAAADQPRPEPSLDSAPLPSSGVAAPPASADAETPRLSAFASDQGAATPPAESPPVESPEPLRAERTELRVPPIEVARRDELKVEPRVITPKVEALRTEPAGLQSKLKSALSKATPNPRPTDAGGFEERREPFLGRPSRGAAEPAEAAAPREGMPRIEVPKRDHPGLPWMMTRLEPAERPIPAAMPASPWRAKGRTGSGWAIGLGAVLLIVGVTSPAAIWQHLRMAMPQRLDQALQLDQAPVPSTNTEDADSQPAGAPPTPTMQAENPPASAPNPQPQQAQSEQAQSEQAQSEQAQAQAEQVPAHTEQAQPQQAQSGQASSEQARSEPAQPQADASAAPQPAAPAQASKPPATELGAVQDGGELAAAPVVPPPAPTGGMTTASVAPQQSAALGTGFPQPFPRAARPFRPDQASTPFQSTRGAAPFNGASAQVALTPSLPPRLKPNSSASVSVPEEAPAVVNSAPTTTTTTRTRSANWGSNPPQNLDQMFELLIDTLAQGRPATPSRGPTEPSNRR